MAHVKQNDLLQGISGRLGGTLIFRNMNGKTFVSTRPRKSIHESTQQKATRSRFKEATEFAKRCMLDAEKKTYYQSRAKKLKLPNAYTAAITDYMRSTSVMRVDTKDAITERKIKIGVHKKGFAVNKLCVSVKDTSGQILETHAAEHLGCDQFVYRTDLVWQDGYTIAIIQ